MLTMARENRRCAHLRGGGGYKRKSGDRLCPTSKETQQQLGAGGEPGTGETPELRATDADG